MRRTRAGGARCLRPARLLPGSFVAESSSTVTHDLGTLFNVPGAREAVEIQMAAEYSCSSTTGIGISVHTEPLGVECYEYKAMLMLHKLEICETYPVTRPSLRGAGCLGYLLGVLASYGVVRVAQLGLQRPTDASRGLLERRECRIFYKQGGLQAYRRWCGGERGG